MKAIRVLIISITLGSFTAVSQAQGTNRGFYLGGGAGGAKYNGFNQLCRDITGSLPGIPVTTSCDSSETALGWKLFVGWRWNQYVALEAGFANLGDAKGDTIIFGQNVNGEISSTAVFGELVGSVPLSQRARLFAKLGVSNIDAELTTDVFAVPISGAPSTAFSKDSTEAVYGAGFEFAFTQKVMGRAEWERFDFEEGIDFFSINVVFYPGQ
jgi:OOP family OmpA-OmpF porin